MVEGLWELPVKDRVYPLLQGICSCNQITSIGHFHNDVRLRWVTRSQLPECFASIFYLLELGYLQSILVGVVTQRHRTSSCKWPIVIKWLVVADDALILLCRLSLDPQDEKDLQDLKGTWWVMRGYSWSHMIHSQAVMMFLRSFQNFIFLYRAKKEIQV